MPSTHLVMSIISLNDKEIFRLTPVPHSLIMRLTFVIKACGKIKSLPLSPINENAKRAATTSMDASKAVKLKRHCVQNAPIKENYEDADPFICLRVLTGNSTTTLGYLGPGR